MKRWLRACSLLILLLCGPIAVSQSAPPAAKATPDYKVLKLLGRSSNITLLNPELTPKEWQKLRAKGTIRLGAWAPNSPPFDITSGWHDYGGISADYLGLIAWNLRFDVEVRYYRSWQDTLNALKKGEIDLIAYASDRDKQAGLVLSVPWIANTPTEVINVNTPSEENSGKKRIAFDTLYQDNAALLQRYAGNTIVNFNSNRRALEALSFRHIDLFIGDSTSTQYLINQSNLNDLSYHPISNIAMEGFSFATTPNNKWLIDIFNKVLKIIPENVRNDIQRRWSGGIPLSLSERHPSFTSLEMKWLSEHNPINIVVMDNMPPLSFFDGEQKLHGITADILEAIALRTGIKFNVIPKNSLHEALEDVSGGKVMMLAGATVDAITQEKYKLLTTRSYLFNSWVLVGKKNAEPLNRPPRIAIIAGQGLDGYLLERYPGSTLLHPEKLTEGLEWVKHGKADNMVLPLANADFILPRFYADSLRVITSLDIEPARFALAVNEDQQPLATILDKALLNIQPEDLHAITRNWYSSSGLVSNEDYSEAISNTLPEFWRQLLLAGAALLLLLFALIGRRQYTLVRQQRELQQALLDHIPTPLFIANLIDGRLAMVNQSFLDSLHMTRADCLGKTLAELNPTFHQLHALPTDDQTVIEAEINHEQRTLRQWYTMFRGPGNRALGWLGGWQDITEQQKTIDDLKQASLMAERANKAKSNFLATMSHEIRTPMSAIIGTLELVLRRRAEGQPDWDSLRVAYEAAQSLLTLIGDILDIARIESDRLVLRPERANIRTLIESVAAMFDGLARQKGLAFNMEIDAEINGDVLIDPMRFKQILSNLLSNAIKFTPQGRIILQAQTESDEITHLQLRVVVQDTGPGIDEQTQARLFQPFEQGDNPAAPNSSGLGLYICKTLAKMMDGDLTLKSQPGIGTETILQLRLPRLASLYPEALNAAACEAGAGNTQAPQPIRILIVEDHQANQMVLKQQLTYLGHTTFTASNGYEALEQLEKHEVDLILTDCSMPEMGGYELTSRLRHQHNPVCIWGMTANAQQVVREKALAMGMNDCLFKPVPIEILEKKINAFSRQLARPAPTTPAAAWRHFHPDAIQRELQSSAEIKSMFIGYQQEAIDEAIGQIHAWRDGAIDDDAFKAALHKLRGGVSMLKATQLVALCQAQEHQPDRHTLDALLDEASALHAELERWKNA